LSFDHKAFAFDFETYRKELRPVLDRALLSGSSDELLVYIAREFTNLKHPFEGGPLPADWDTQFDTRSSQFTGELAMTRYFDPSEDLGLPGDEIIKGEVVGPPEAPFDPGLMDSYLQDPACVERNHQRLLAATSIHGEAEIQNLIGMLKVAADRKLGLYVVF
jgi:hypothetical protein